MNLRHLHLRHRGTPAVSEVPPASPARSTRTPSGHAAGLRRSAVALLAAAGCLVVVLPATGCGVPTHTDVQIEGPPAEAARAGNDGAQDPPPGPEEAGNERELVEFFLQAAAADPENAVEVLREFLHPDLRDQWQPDPRVYVARIEDPPVVTPGDPVRFDLSVRRVGGFSPNGVIEPRTSQDEDFTYSVASEPRGVDDDVRVTGERYWLVEVPAVILLDDAALERHFDWRPVYFWDSDHGRLVPDLRWVPRAVTETQRLQFLVDWLVAGPAAWLAGTLTPLPAGVERDGNVVWNDDGASLEVRLTAPSEADLGQLDAQLWWTLRPDSDLSGGTDVMVVVNGTERPFHGGYRGSNAVPPDDPASFAVLGGEVLQYVPAEPPVQLQALPDELNADIVHAAMTRNGRLAALVRPEPDGRMRLTVAAPQDVTVTGLVAQSMGQPLWLSNPSDTGLVVADGELRQFTVGVEAVSAVDLDLPGPVTAVAAAPDGRRLALIAGGRLYLASVARAGGVLSVTAAPQPLPTTATDLDGVAFIREEWLAIVGTAGGQSQLFELTVDGALERDLPGGPLGTPEEISGFVAYPGDPADPADRGTIMYEAGEFIWRYVYPRDPAPVYAADVLGEEPAAGDDVPEPRSPFFLN